MIYEGFASYQEKERTQAIETARIKAIAVDEEWKNKEIELRREKYAEVAEIGGEKLTVNIIKKSAEELIEKNRIANNGFLIAKSNWIKENNAK